MEPKLDMEGLLKAFSDHERKDREYVLDTETGTIHFVPTEFLLLADKGELDPEKYQGQARERAEIVMHYLDDISGRYEMIPYLDPEAENDWRQEFLTERGATSVTPELQVAWNVYRMERLQDEAVLWLEDAGIFDSDDDEEVWEEE